MYPYKYPHPAVTVDCVVFGLDEGDLKVLLIQRDQDPYQGAWAIPGGFVGIDEDLEAAARRELEEETAVRDLYLEQLYTFGAPNRDPRERVITVAYFAIVKLCEHPVTAATDARNAAWFEVDDLPELAFDHKEILNTAVARLRAKIRYDPIVFAFLPEKFTLRQVQERYERILGTVLDKRNFRRKLHATGVAVPLDEVESDVPHRSARLYRFDRERYEQLRDQGYEWTLG